MSKEAVIFFDLDGTLYSYEEGHTAGLKGSYPYWAELTGQTFNEFMETYYKSRVNVKRFLKGTVGSHSRALYFQGMFDENFKTLQPFHIAELIQRYWDYFIKSMKPFEGVEETLQNLKKQGYRLAIITNMSAEIQFRKLHKLKLDNYFDAIITSEEAGQEKPHPHIYLHAINRLKVKPFKCIMIGDDHKNDVEAAEYIGMKGVLVTIENDPTQVTCSKISSFKDLLEIIENFKVEPLEGVIKYKLHHRSMENYMGNTDLGSLITLRDQLWRLNLIGVYPNDHYLTPGVGFGNASERYTSDGQFIISGSQTGELKETSTPHFALVMDFDIETNEVFSKGPIKPSSESMTHAAVYDVAPEVNCVIHIHHENMWKHFKKLKLLTTPKNVPYGTPEMAKAIKEAYLTEPVLRSPVCMLGHMDGLIAWGETKGQALKFFTDALEELNRLGLD